MIKFKHSIVAGTFDHLHSGHEKLLTTAFNNSNYVSCGLANTSLTKNKSFYQLIQNQKYRHYELKKLFSKFNKQYSIFNLQNQLEPAISSLKFNLIITSKQTAFMIPKINNLRQQNNLKPLNSIIVSLVKSTDKKIISSTRIRKGEINRNGFVFYQALPKKPLILAKENRSLFRRPFSQLIEGASQNLDWAGLKIKKILKSQKPILTITVGDISTSTLLKQNIIPSISIVDLKTQRKKLFNNLKHLGLNSKSDYIAINPPSQLTPDLINKIQSAISKTLINKKPQIILVKGEEDLSALPAILLSPLKTAIIYGQPNKGLVYINVTEKNKQKALTLLQKLSPHPANFLITNTTE